MPRRGLVATYHIDIERDESGAWIATVAGVPGAHTYGRSLHQVRQRAREALSLWVDDAERAELEFELHLPRDARTALRRASSARKATVEAAKASSVATNDAALFLVRDWDLSLRDAAELLGLSHQRLQQLLADQERRPA
jgi:predicted RNase H-like HicB family nuclease